MNINRWSRKLHRWGAILCALPLLLVIATGILLQVKKQVPWVQPPTQKGVGKIPSIEFDEILAVSKSVKEAEIDDWSDVERMDVQPGKGIVKVQSRNQWELQIDLNDSAILSSTYRRSDWIESLHDGSWFNDSAKLWIFLPNGLILLGLWVTGVYLWCLPFISRAKKKKRLDKNISTPESK